MLNAPSLPLTLESGMDEGSEPVFLSGPTMYSVLVRITYACACASHNMEVLPLSREL